jgi:curved DNA-binding protein CbpA/CheY-like chemotaxis protein
VAKKNFYQILGIRPDAPVRSIKIAYRDLARKLHPDALVHQGASVQARAKEAFFRLQEAYEVLSKETQRDLYDDCLRTGKSFSLLQEIERPESQAERSARETAEKELEDACGEVLQKIETSLRIANLGRRWMRQQETYEYFDRVLTSTQSTQRNFLLIKILPILGPADLPGIFSFAKNMVARRSRSLIVDHYSFLLIGRTVRCQKDLLHRVEGFNRKNWNQIPPRRSRAFVGFCGVMEENPHQPGVDQPVPDLIAVFSAVTASTPPAAPLSVAPPRSKASPLQAPKEAVTLLQVDDDPFTLRFMKELFEKQGWAVHQASCWPEFRSLILEIPASIILLDVNMPGLTGDKLALFIRENPEIDPKPPILFFSGLPADKLQKLVNKTGVAGYLSKGMSPEQIVMGIRGCLQRKLRAEG